MSKFLVERIDTLYPTTEKSVLSSLFEEYERVIVESLITTFGLDWIIKDQYGGDVDTIHNVRNIGKDEQMAYKNSHNEQAYQSMPEYNSSSYHQDKRFIQQRRNNQEAQLQGQLHDSYTGKRFTWNDKVDLDHTISAKEIHSDRGRVLANLKGEDLANQPTNLNATNMRTNRTKKAETMDDFTSKYGDEYTQEQQVKMKAVDQKARRAYDGEIKRAYYTSPKFAKDVGIAASKQAAAMGAKQAVGFIFTEMWFAVKEEFTKLDAQFEFQAVLEAIANGIKMGFERAKIKYKALFERFIHGTLAGALASLTTTLCNVFFTTAKNTIKIIRLSYASLVEALNILFINPENYDFGERLRSVSKVIATGASIVTGTLVSEALGQTGLAAIPVIGDLIQTFSGTLVTGIMSCTLLYFLDQSELVNKLIHHLDQVHTVETEVNYYRQQAAYFQSYAAKLLEIDYQAFQNETAVFERIVEQLADVQTPMEMNQLLQTIYQSTGIQIPWSGNFNEFMNDQQAQLVFE